MVQLSHPYLTTRKVIRLTIWTFVSQVMSLLLNTLSMVCHGFLSKEEVSLNFMTAATIHSDSGAQENKICHCIHFFPFYLLWSHGAGCLHLHFFECWVLSQLFHSPLSPSSKGSLVPLNFLPLGWYHLHIWGYWYFSWQSWFQLVIHPAWHFTWCTLNIS